MVEEAAQETAPDAQSSVRDVERTLQPGGSLHFWTNVEEYFQASLELLAAHTALRGPLPVPEPPAEHDMAYRTHFDAAFAWPTSRSIGRTSGRQRREKAAAVLCAAKISDDADNTTILRCAVDTSCLACQGLFSVYAAGSRLCHPRAIYTLTTIADLQSSGTASRR